MLVEYCFSVEETLQSYKKSVLVLVEYITYYDLLPTYIYI